MSLIIVDDVHKSFGNIEVLKGVSLQIKSGEVISLLGRSGSGKTTLLRCLNGLEAVSQGSISVDGAEVNGHEGSLRMLRLKLGMVFQQFNLFPHLTVGKNVMLAQTVVKKTDKARARAMAELMLERVGLAAKFDAYPSQLSGGQQQRVAIARALAMQPIAILCDEITSALDPELVDEVLGVIKQLAADGMTLIMVTHEMRFARQVSSRVVFMHEGCVHEQGPPESLFCNPQSNELRQFLRTANSGNQAA